MNSVSDGEDNLIHGITPLGSMDFDESSSIPQSPMGVLRGGMSGMYVSDAVDQQQQDKAVISEILNSPLTKYSSPSLSDLFGDDEFGGGLNVFALPGSSLQLNTRRTDDTRNLRKALPNKKSKVTNVAKKVWVGRKRQAEIHEAAQDEQW